jgi:hypothetical protein
VSPKPIEVAVQLTPLRGPLLRRLKHGLVEVRRKMPTVQVAILRGLVQQKEGQLVLRDRGRAVLDALLKSGKRSATTARSRSRRQGA